MLEQPGLAEWLAEMTGIVEAPARTADLTDVARDVTG